MRAKNRIAILGRMGPHKWESTQQVLSEYLFSSFLPAFRIRLYGKKPADPNHVASLPPKVWISLPFKPNSFLYHLCAFVHATWFADVMLIFGTAGGYFFPFIRFFSRKKLVLSIGQVKWKGRQLPIWQKMWLRQRERLAVKFAHTVVAEDSAIVGYLRSTYQIEAILVQHGGDHVNARSLSEKTVQQFAFLRHRYVFCEAEILPRHQLEMVLQSFAQYSKYQLIMVGDWESSPYGRKLKSHYAQYDTIHLLSSGLDASLIQQIRAGAWLYLHNVHAWENSLGLIEAMSLGLPVLAYDLPNHRETTHHQALYYQHQAQIVDQLKALSPKQRNRIGSRLYDIAQRHFRWHDSSLAYQAVLEKALPGNRKKALPAISGKAVATVRKN